MGKPLLNKQTKCPADSTFSLLRKKMLSSLSLAPHILELISAIFRWSNIATRGRPLLQPSGEAESPNLGIRRKQIYPSDFFPSSASIFPLALYQTNLKKKPDQELDNVIFFL